MVITNFRSGLETKSFLTLTYMGDP